MVIDSSAIVAILAQEADALVYARAIERDRAPLISAATVLEATLVLTRWYGDGADREVDAFLHAAAAEIVPFDAVQLRLATQAYLQFGKGRHPAGLNFGDCMSYALAKATGEPLLYKGDDFARTDMRSAL